MSGLRRKPLTPKTPNVATAAPPKSRSPPPRRRPSPPAKHAAPVDALQLQARLAASEMKRSLLEQENVALRADAEKKSATIATLRAELGAARRAAVAAAATAPAAAAAAAAAVRPPKVASVSSDGSVDAASPFGEPVRLAAGALSGRVNPTGAVLAGRHAPRASSAIYVPPKLAAPTKTAPASPEAKVLAEGFVPIEPAVEAPPPPPVEAALIAPPSPPPPAEAPVEAPADAPAAEAPAVPPVETPPAEAPPARTLRRSPRAATPPPVEAAAAEAPPVPAPVEAPPQRAKRVPKKTTAKRIPKKPTARRRRSVRLASADADESPAAAPAAPAPAAPAPAEPAPTPAKKVVIRVPASKSRERAASLTAPSPVALSPAPPASASAKKKVVIRAPVRVKTPKRSPAKPRTPAKTPTRTPNRPSPHSLVASAAAAWSATKKASAKKGRRSFSSPARTRDLPTPREPTPAGCRRRSRSPPPPSRPPTPGSPARPTPRRSARKVPATPATVATHETVATDDYAGVLAWDGDAGGVLEWSPRSSASPWKLPTPTPTPPKPPTPLSKPLSGPRLSEDSYGCGVLAWDGDDAADGLLAWSPRASVASAHPRASLASTASPRASVASAASLASVASPVAATTSAASAFDRAEVTISAALQPWVAAACAAEAALTPPATAGRVRFRRCDFSSVAPPCDTARGSERETEAAVAALGKVAAAGDALGAALWTDDNACDDARRLRDALREVSQVKGEAGGAAHFWSAELDAILTSGRDASPVRARLGELCVSGLRFHLRRLLNQPPVPQNPSTDAAIYDWSRSRAHTFIRVEICVNGEPSEGALATEVASAL